MLRQELPAVAVLGLVVALATQHLLLAPAATWWEPQAALDLLAVEQLQRVITGQQGWGEAWLGWPVESSLGQTDWLLGQAVLALPLAPLPPPHRFTVLALLGMVATAWVGHRIGAAVLGAGPHSWVVGAAAGLAPYLLGLGTPLGLVHGWAVLGGALLLGQGLASRQATRAGIGALLAAGSAHLGWQQGAHAAVLLTALAALAALRGWGDRRSRAAAAAGLAIGLLSLILPALPALRLALEHGASWAPSLHGTRWLVLGVFVASLGLAAAMQRRGLHRVSPRWRVVYVLITLGFLLCFLPRQGLRDEPVPALPEVYLGLEAAPDGPLYERFTTARGACGCDGGPSLQAALEHDRPLVGGTWSWEHPGLEALEAMAGRFPEAQSAELLRILGVAVVIEHSPITGEPPVEASCQRVGQHRLCALEPILPGGLPSEEVVETLGRGPVVGLRWPDRPTGERLEIRCERQRPWRTTTQAWWVIAQLRHGGEPPWMDVYLPQACSTVPTSGEGSPVPLYATAAMSLP